MTCIGFEWTVNSVGINGARPCARQISVPDFVGILGKVDAFELALSTRIEETEFDSGGVGGKERKIDAQTVPGRAERKRLTFAYARSSQPLRGLRQRDRRLHVHLKFPSPGGPTTPGRISKFHAATPIEPMPARPSRYSGQHRWIDL